MAKYKFPNGRIAEVIKDICIIEEDVPYVDFERNFDPTFGPAFHDRWSDRLFGDNRATVMIQQLSKPHIKTDVTVVRLKFQAEVGDVPKTPA